MLGEVGFNYTNYTIVDDVIISRNYTCVHDVISSTNSTRVAEIVNVTNYTCAADVICSNSDTCVANATRPTNRTCFPDALHYTCADDVTDTTVSVFYYPLYMHITLIAIFVPTIIFNVITLLVFLGNRRMRNKSAVFLCSVAVSDLLFALTAAAFGCLGLTDVDLTGRDPVIFKPLDYFWWFSTAANYGFFLAMSLERWLYIARPFAYSRWVRKAFFAVLVASIWVLAGLFASATLIVGSSGVFFIGVYLLPVSHTAGCCFIFAIYYHIVVITRNHIAAISKTVPRSYTKNIRDQILTPSLKHWRAVRLFLTVFVFFAVSLSPYVYVNAYKTYHGNNELDSTRIYLLRVSSLHYCANFVIYIWQNSAFRNVLKTWLFRWARMCKIPSNVEPINTVTEKLQVS